MKDDFYFKKTGTDGKVVILFHGFGQDHTAFHTLLPLLQKTNTIYSFDLFYHGKSNRKDQPLSRIEWRKRFAKFLLKEKIPAFSMIAFSLGGRFALATAIDFPEKIEKIILVAPDGIYNTFWYLFATSKIGNPLFRYLMRHPYRFFWLLDHFEKWKLVSPSMISFARKELTGRKNCLLVYRSWTYFRTLQLAPMTFISVMNEYKITIHAIFGEKDFIIPADKILPKLSGLDRLKSHILPVKHHELIGASKELIASLLNEENL